MQLIIVIYYYNLIIIYKPFTKLIKNYLYKIIMINTNFSLTNNMLK